MGGERDGGGQGSAGDGDDGDGRRRGPRHDLTIKVRVSYPTRDKFTAHFSQNLSAEGLFIRAKDPAPIGTRLRVDYVLGDGSTVMSGVGLVRWVRHAGPENDEAHAPGMGVELLEVDGRGGSVFNELIANRGAVIPSWLSRLPALVSAEPAAVTESDWRGQDATGKQRPAEPDDLPAPLSALKDEDAASGPDTDEHEVTRAPDVEPEWFPAENTPVPPGGPILVSESPELDLKTGLLIDLCGVDLLAALALDMDGGVEAAVPSSTTPRLLAEADGVVVHPSGIWVPCLLQLLGATAPSPSALVWTRRFGLGVTYDGEGRVALRLGRNIVTVREALSACLRELLEPYGNSDMLPATTRVVLPNLASPLALELVGSVLGSFGYTRAEVVSDALACGVAMGLSPSSSKPALVVQANGLELRVSLLMGRQPPITRAALDLGLWRADDLLAHEVLMRWLREGPASDLPAVHKELARAITSTRTEAQDDSPWQLNAAGRTLVLPKSELVALAQPLSERVLLACGELLEQAGVRPRDLQMLLLAPDEPLWPGLAESLERGLQLKATYAGARAWTRINGAALLLAQQRGR